MLEISPLIMIVTFVIFIAMLYLLNQKLYGPLLKFMDDRDATLSRNLKEAQSLSGNSDDLESQAQAVIDEAKSIAAQQRQGELEKLQQELAEKISSKQDEMNAKFEEFKASLIGEKDALQAKLLSDMPLLKESLKAKFGQL